MFGFFIDVIAILILTTIASVFVFLLGIFTLGLAWLLLPIIWQAVALCYTAFTLGGPNAATPGMRAMGLEMRLTNGMKPYPLFAAIHALLFWFSVALLTPLILLISLFSDRKRLLHDMILGSVIVNSSVERR
ncbi:MULTISPECIES: RDD family protein [Pseudovibrio]|uniref:RDD family protein n=1 Tax=Stappiaceae TaxID=2821832 RepID=UPI0029C3820C|nr:RDD family protein [Pseudovibrio sp. SPO723]MDX5592501.1 RDD family protein [Pseudovibrio sp. SPO723]